LTEKNGDLFLNLGEVLVTGGSDTHVLVFSNSNASQGRRAF